MGLLSERSLNLNIMPLISIAMPAYNVEKYIAAAIESIISQTYTNWELIIVDDCSTDQTISIIEEYLRKDRRITLIKRGRNSGGCRLPRFDAILAAKGDFVCPIDSDDTIEKTYLEKLIRRQEDTSADIVLSRIVYCDESQNPKGATIPDKSYDMDIILSGIDICKETIGGWKISMSGLIAKRTLYQNYIKQEYYSDFNKSFADEIDHRKILISTNRISMVDAHYFYRQQPNSIIHTTSVNYYDLLIANKILLDFIITTYKDDRELLHRMYNEYIEKVYRSQQKYYTYIKQYNAKERKHIKSLIKESYSFIKKHELKFSTTRNKILSTSHTLFKLYTWIVIFIVKIRS